MATIIDMKNLLDSQAMFGFILGEIHVIKSYDLQNSIYDSSLKESLKLFRSGVFYLLIYLAIIVDTFRRNGTMNCRLYLSSLNV